MTSVHSGKNSNFQNYFSEDGGDPIVEDDDAEEKRKQFKKQRSKQSREFEVEGDIAKPEFMATKSMVDYAPAEISAVEQYEALLAEQAERKAIRRRQLEVDRVELVILKLSDRWLNELYALSLSCSYKSPD